MRRSNLLAIAAATVTVILLGGWLLLSQGELGGTGAGSRDPAPLTELRRPSRSYSSSPQSDPYPRVPSAQIKNGSIFDVRAAADGRQLLVPVFDTDCSFDEVRLLSEQGDRVEIQIRMIGKPKPATLAAAPDGSYSCLSGQSMGAQKHAVITLQTPLGARDVVLVLDR
jgi:hypothetical protein